MRRVVLPVLAALGIAIAPACGDDDGDEDGAGGAPQCSAWLESGPSSTEAVEGCTTEGGTVLATEVHACDDGRTLYWNDAMWGYAGEPAHSYTDTGAGIAPEADRVACPVP